MPKNNNIKMSRKELKISRYKYGIDRKFYVDGYEDFKLKMKKLNNVQNKTIILGGDKKDDKIREN